MILCLELVEIHLASLLVIAEKPPKVHLLHIGLIAIDRMHSALHLYLQPSAILPTDPKQTSIKICADRMKMPVATRVTASELESNMCIFATELAVHGLDLAIYHCSGDVIVGDALLQDHSELADLPQ